MCQRVLVWICLFYFIVGCFIAADLTFRPYLDFLMFRVSSEFATQSIAGGPLPVLAVVYC